VSRPTPRTSDRPIGVDDVWTEERIRALGVRTEGVIACEIIYGDRRTKAYERLRAGDVDFPVIKRGRRYIVPTAAILGLLGLGGDRASA
jgi:hypothetical protein